VVNIASRPLYSLERAIPPVILDRRLDGPQSRSGQYGEVKILDLTGTRTLTSLSFSQSLYLMRCRGSDLEGGTSRKSRVYRPVSPQNCEIHSVLKVRFFSAYPPYFYWQSASEVLQAVDFPHRSNLYCHFAYVGFGLQTAFFQCPSVKFLFQICLSIYLLFMLYII
jgi:hypothetical protein